jgi:hypothetical protein
MQSSHPLDNLLRGCREAFAHRSSDLSNANDDDDDDDDDSSMLFKDALEANVVEDQQPLRYENDGGRTQDDIRRIWRSHNQHDQQIPPAGRIYVGYSSLPRLVHREDRNDVLADNAPITQDALDDGLYGYPVQASEIDKYTTEIQGELFSLLPGDDGDGNVRAVVEEAEDEFHGFWQPNILY